MQALKYDAYIHALFWYFFSYLLVQARSRSAVSVYLIFCYLEDALNNEPVTRVSMKMLSSSIWYMRIAELRILGLGVLYAYLLKLKIDAIQSFSIDCVSRLNISCSLYFVSR